MKNIIVTGGAGFIGTNLLLKLVNKYPDYKFINLDSLTYAGNISNLKTIENKTNYFFENVNILDEEKLKIVFEKYKINTVLHLAAESHVDRSIKDPYLFIETNVLGTAKLLNTALKYWGNDMTDKIFYHISTDEVFGSLGDKGFFTENTSYDPRSPYSASKASSDHLVRAFYHTYKLPILISNCSNNYGPYQFPEKLIPLMINNIKNNLPLPVYGKGDNIRDWLWVEDHVDAIDTILHNGIIGETYNIGGNNEVQNIDMVFMLCDILDKKLNRKDGESRKLIQYIEDRKGHDKRYAIDSSKLQNELNWIPKIKVNEGIEMTIDWYLENENWLNNITSGKYRDYYIDMYQK